MNISEGRYIASKRLYVCMYGEIRKENFIKLQLLLFLTLEAFSRFFCVNLTVVTIFMLCL